MYSYTETRSEPGFMRLGDTIIDLRKVNYIQKRGEELHVQFENEDSCLIRGFTIEQVSGEIFRDEKTKSK